MNEITNIVFLAILPMVTDFASRTGIDFELPVCRESVAKFSCKDVGDDFLATLILTNGSQFIYSNGQIDSFMSAQSYRAATYFPDLSRYYGAVHLTEKGAVAMARRAALAVASDRRLFLDLEPRVAPFEKVGSNTIPRYFVEWIDPRSGAIQVSIEINCDLKRIEGIQLISNYLWRDPPATIKTAIGKRPDGAVPSTFKMEEPPEKVFKCVDEYVKALQLPVAYPVFMASVSKWQVLSDPQGPIVKLKLTNGFTFEYQDGGVYGFAHADAFFQADSLVDPRDIQGARNCSEENAISFVRDAAHKLGYDTKQLGMHSKPSVRKPVLVDQQLQVPRVKFTWYGGEGGVMTTYVSAEVNLGDKSLKSLTIFGGFRRDK